MALASVGVPEAVYWETYREARNDAGGLMTYSDKRHAEALAARGFVYDLVFKQLAESVAQAKAFLASDAISFLHFLKSTGEPLVLLSLGEPGMQEWKVRQSGIHDFFDRLFFVDAGKKQILSELQEAESGDCSCWLVNDKVGETKELLEAFPKLRAVLRRSDSIPITEYEESGLPYFKTLTGIQHYIERYGKK